MNKPIIMTDLIQDFSNHTSRLHSPSSYKKKRVQFSKTSSLKLVTRIDEMSDTSKIWYSSNDYKAMRAETKRAVQDANDALSALSSSDQDLADKVGNMNDIVLAGIEGIITPRIVKRSRICRAKYMNAVLNEQDEQYSAGFYDADRLARAARGCSKSSVKRAQSIALLQSK